MALEFNLHTSIVIIPALVGGVLSYLSALAMATIHSNATASRRDRQERWSSRPVSNYGGLGILAGFFAAVLAVWLVFPDYAKFETGLLILLCGAVAAGILGFLDDRFNLSPFLRLCGLAVISLVAAESGTLWRLTGIHAVDLVLTAGFLAAAANAVNFIDNIDGLAGGAVLIGSSLLLLLAHTLQAQSLVVISTALLGACAGFLVLNFPPAKIYMGDTGSYFMGFLLSGLTLQLANASNLTDAGYLLFPFTPILLPLFDMIFVVITRTARGQKFYHGGSDHISHRISRLGLGPRSVLIVLYLFSIIGAGAAYLMLDGIGLAEYLLLATGMLLLVFFAFYISKTDYTGAAGDASSHVAHLATRESYLERYPLLATLLDAVILSAVLFGSYLLRFTEQFHLHMDSFVVNLIIALPVKLFSLHFFGLYSTSYHRLSARLVRSLLKVAFSSMAVIGLIQLLVFRFEHFSRSVLVIDFVLTYFILLMSRCFFHLLDYSFGRLAIRPQNMMIVGASPFFERMADLLTEEVVPGGRIKWIFNNQVDCDVLPAEYVRNLITFSELERILSSGRVDIVVFIGALEERVIKSVQGRIENSSIITYNIKFSLEKSDPGAESEEENSL